MKKILLLTLLSSSFSVLSATEQTIWMKPAKVLSPYQITVSTQGLVQQQISSHSEYGLEKMPEQAANTDHIRYTQTYHNIPIWGRQLIIHRQKHPGSGRTTTLVSGTMISGIEKDIRDPQPILTNTEATINILNRVTTPIKAKQVQLIIYVDNMVAHTAYLLSYYTTDETKGISNPHYIVNANDGTILKQWDAAHNLSQGSGPGGNTTPLPFRGGAFQYGDSLPNLPSLGTFPQDRWVIWYYMQTPNYNVISLKNQSISASDINYIFPIYGSEEKKYNLTSVNGLCMPWTKVCTNQDDNGESPINGAYSPNNDAMYFVNATFEMYQSYGINYPLGQKDLPLRVFTHINGFDNAFALPTIYFKDTNTIKAHQQIVLSNGFNYFTALTQSVIAHELSHNFTSLNAGLIYSGQSGGINESFSDMAAMAVMDHIRTQFPFYWDGEDWSFGREATKNGTPLRYIDNPAQDGLSIDNAKNYTSKLDVHYSSGVFNRAFYLLSKQPGWSIHNAFQVMIDANQHYWEPNATFERAACGVIQAALDRELDTSGVINAFAQVGITCSA